MYYSKEEQIKKFSELYGRPISEGEYQVIAHEICSLFEVLRDIDESCGLELEKMET